MGLSAPICTNWKCWDANKTVKTLPQGIMKKEGKPDFVKIPDQVKKQLLEAT